MSLQILFCVESIFGEESFFDCRFCVYRSKIKIDKKAFRTIIIFVVIKAFVSLC
jgi:hypothetical protein